MIDLKERKKFIGGSDAAGVLGMSRWKTPLSVWADKTGQYEDKVQDNEAMMLGRELEDYVARRFERKAEKKVRRINKALYHKKYKFIAVNVDRDIVGEEKKLECKTVSAWKAKEWEEHKIPKEYILQCQHTLMVTGDKSCFIAVLIGNQEFLWDEIKRDEELIKEIEKKEVEFWTKYVIPKVMPATIYSSDSDTLTGLYKGMTVEAPIIELDDEANKIIEVIQANNQDLKVLENIVDQNKNKLKAMLKEHQAGETNLHKVTWKEQLRRTLDSKKIKEEEPAVYAQYVKESTSRVLKIYDK